jgi:MoxR-like ATPase
VVVYEDSALVKAAKYGRVLVIDEADKAPLEVVSILKGLVEDGRMALSDGRVILRDPGAASVDATNVVPLHKDFKLIGMAFFH